MRNQSLGKLVLVVSAFALFGACGETKKVEGPGGQELKLTAPTDQTIERGESKSFTVRIDRDDFSGPIALALTGLPSGVSHSGELNIPSGSDSRELSLVANENAALVENQLVTIRATPTGADGLGPVSATFKVTVKAKD